MKRLSIRVRRWGEPATVTVEVRVFNQKAWDAPFLFSADYYLQAPRHPTLQGELYNVITTRFADERDWAYVARILDGLSFAARKAGIRPPRPAGTPQPAAEQRLRKRLALELALSARDALVQEVIDLRERVEDLERRANNAERWAEEWQDTAMALQDQGAGQIGLSKEGHVGVLREASA